jgi:hypothetical protein
MAHKEEYDSEATVDTIVIEEPSICKSVFPTEMKCYKCDSKEYIECYMYCNAKVCCIHFCGQHAPSSQPCCMCPEIKEEEEEET